LFAGAWWSARHDTPPTKIPKTHDHYTPEASTVSGDRYHPQCWRKCYQQALTLFRDLGDRYDEAATLTNLGDTHHAAGNPDAARDAWQHALTILDDLDHPDADQVRTKLAALDTSTHTDQLQSG
jgi:hypothetical protein